MELLTTEIQKNIKTFIANSRRVLINTKSQQVIIARQKKYKFLCPHERKVQYKA
jgi:hypothetical protein